MQSLRTGKFLYEEGCEGTSGQSVAGDDVIRATRKRLLKTVSWPMPFSEMLDLIEGGWDKLTSTSDLDKPRKWSHAVMNKLCFPDGDAALECTVDKPATVTPCERNEGTARSVYRRLAKVARWRFAEYEDAVYSPCGPRDGDFPSIRQLQPLFMMDLERTDETE